MRTLPRDTAELLDVERDGVNFRKCDSRSLMLDRYANPSFKKDDRRDFLNNALSRKPDLRKLQAWRQFLLAGLRLTAGQLLFGELQARLILNASGGVLENAGLCLDRFSGVPFIPGSAVKGCARRMALQTLSEQTESTAKAKLLGDIARAFGWGDTDWKDGRNRKGELYSDFEFACGEGRNWEQVRDLAADCLRARLRLKIKSAKPICEQLGSYGGDVCFMPGFPWELPAGDLELDVLTSHHPSYYSDAGIPVALDTEEPNPVFFPTVAPGLVFAFPVVAADTELASAARGWLHRGLETFGLGGKTSAGYGWFECERTTANMAGILAKQLKDRMLTLERASLQPNPVLLERLAKLTPADLAGVLNQFSVEPRFWKPDNQASELSVLHFCTVVNPQICTAARANPKGKAFKALQNLAKKFNRTLPQ
jgi:CRISPR-associated protein Cmr6